QGVGLLLQAAGGGGRFLDQAGVLAGDVVHLGDRGIDLFDAGGLLAAGRADLAHDVGDAVDAVDDVLHRGPGARGLLVALGGRFHRGVDEALDLFGGARRALGQRPDFGSHHGEAAALFAGAGGLDGGVQRQNVGLEGDAVDHADDVGDLLGLGVDLAHGGDQFGDDGAAVGGGLGGRGGQGVGLLGVVGVLAHGGGDLFHRGGGLGQGTGLLFGARGQVLVAGADLRRGRGD